MAELGVGMLEFVEGLNAELAAKQPLISAGNGISIVSNVVSSTSLNFRVWSSSISYIQNDVVEYNNFLYICNTAHTSGSTFDSSKWTLLNASTYYWNRNSFTVLADATTLNLTLSSACSSPNNLFIFVDGKTLVPYECITVNGTSVTITSVSAFTAGTTLDVRWTTAQIDSEKANIDLSNVSNNIDYIISENIDTTTGAFYSISKKGICEQSGYASTDGAIVLGRNYANTLYNISLTPVASASTGTYPICVEAGSVTTSGFTVHSDGLPFYWRCKGLIASS